MPCTRPEHISVRTRCMGDKQRLHTYIRKFVHTYINTYIHTYVRTYVRTYVPAYIHTYIRTHVLAYIHIWGSGGDRFIFTTCVYILLWEGKLSFLAHIYLYLLPLFYMLKQQKHTHSLFLSIYLLFNFIAWKAKAKLRVLFLTVDFLSCFFGFPYALYTYSCSTYYTYIYFIHPSLCFAFRFCCFFCLCFLLFFFFRFASFWFACLFLKDSAFFPALWSSSFTLNRNSKRSSLFPLRRSLKKWNSTGMLLCAKTSVLFFVWSVSTQRFLALRVWGAFVFIQILALMLLAHFNLHKILPRIQIFNRIIVPGFKTVWLDTYFALGMKRFYFHIEKFPRVYKDLILHSILL